MKKEFMIALIVVCFLIAGCSQNQNKEITAKPLLKLMDQLIPIPDLQQHLYGNSERTQMLFNLIALKEICIKYENQIKELQADIMLLKMKENPNAEK